jgi:hypothetical protein
MEIMITKAVIRRSPLVCETQLSLRVFRGKRLSKLRLKLSSSFIEFASVDIDLSR